MNYQRGAYTNLSSADAWAQPPWKGGKGKGKPGKHKQASAHKYHQTAPHYAPYPPPGPPEDSQQLASLKVCAMLLAAAWVGYKVGKVTKKFKPFHPGTIFEKNAPLAGPEKGQPAHQGEPKKALGNPAAAQGSPGVRPTLWDRLSPPALLFKGSCSLVMVACGMSHSAGKKVTPALKYGPEEVEEQFFDCQDDDSTEAIAHDAGQDAPVLQSDFELGFFDCDDLIAELTVDASGQVASQEIGPLIEKVSDDAMPKDDAWDATSETLSDLAETFFEASEALHEAVISTTAQAALSGQPDADAEGIHGKHPQKNPCGRGEGPVVPAATPDCIAEKVDKAPAVSSPPQVRIARLEGQLEVSRQEQARSQAEAAETGRLLAVSQHLLATKEREAADLNDQLEKSNRGYDHLARCGQGASGIPGMPPLALENPSQNGEKLGGGTKFTPLQFERKFPHFFEE